MFLQLHSPVLCFFLLYTAFLIYLSCLLYILTHFRRYLFFPFFLLQVLLESGYHPVPAFLPYLSPVCAKVGYICPQVLAEFLSLLIISDCLFALPPVLFLCFHVLSFSADIYFFNYLFLSQVLLFVQALPQSYFSFQ